MSHEGLKTNTTPEKSTVSPEAIAQAFTTGRNYLQKLTADPRLHEKLLTVGINPFKEGATRSRYWHMVASHAQERIALLHDKGADQLQLDTLELLAKTPDFLFAQYGLKNDLVKNSQVIKNLKHTTSNYNQTVRQYASRYPSARPSNMATGILGVVNSSIEQKDLRQASAALVNNMLRGAQYELVTSQLLEHTGRGFRAATTEEDLAGIDFVVGGNYGDLYLDAKSSDHDIRDQLGFNGVYGFSGANTIRIKPLVTARELGDSFRVSDDLAEQRGAQLDAILTRAEIEQSGGFTSLTYSG